ncbi:M48 family metalloprotease [Psychromonas sp. PT13]|uniref:beta-barrel assembly-enhancing protease n=1 Tax=Psychromonas sp. PT13 TaxID=3439547 RepID=UPI003EBFBBE2
MKNKYRILSLLLPLLFLPPVIQAEDKLPEIGTIGAGALTIAEEKEYGWAFQLMVNQKLPVIQDPVLNYYINELGDNLVANADSVKLPFHFFLIKDKEINAAAFLGGNIKINSGLFLYATNESELASVIAHEIAHITQRHLARMLEQQSLSNPASLAALAGSVLLSLVSPAAGMAALSTTLAITTQSQINYTRAHEYEADRIGIQTLAKAGYSPNGMAAFFSKLAQKYQYASALPEMLSTHPLTETRLAEARLRASQYPTKKIENSLDYQLSKARITVRYGNMTAESAINAYQSELKNTTYQLKDAALYGLALGYFNHKEFEKADKIATDLLAEKPNNLFYIDLLTDTSIALNQVNKIIPALSEHYNKSPENTVYVLNLTQALMVNKQYQEAAKIIELFIRSHPNHILAHRMAIDIYKKLKDKAKEYNVHAQYLALQGRFKEASQEMANALAYTDNRLDQARYSAKIEIYKKSDVRLQALQK